MSQTDALFTQWPGLPPRQRRALAAAGAVALGLHALLLLGLPRLPASAPAGLTTNAFATRVVAVAAPSVALPPTAPAAPSDEPEPSALPPPSPSPAQPAAVPPPTANPRPRRAVSEPEASETTTPAPAARSAPATSAGAPANAEPSLLSLPPSFDVGPFPSPSAITTATTDVEDAVVTAHMQGSGDAPVLLPRSAQVGYRASGRHGDLEFSAPATLSWRHDGSRYETSLSFHHAKLGTRQHTAAGLLAPQGLAPFHAAVRTDIERKIRFDYGQQRTLFEPSSTEAPLPAGVRDELSALVQIGALLAAASHRDPVGTAISLPLAKGDAVVQAVFTIEGQEEVTALGGRLLKAWRVVHVARGDGQPTVEAWLSPALEYLPVRLRVTQPNGDFIDYLANKALAVTVLPSTR